MLAREVWEKNRPEFVRRFLEMKDSGLCRGLYLFGSVYHGDDHEMSDLDLMVTLKPNASFEEIMLVEQNLGEWIPFPIHVSCVPNGFGDYMVATKQAEKVV